MRIVKTITRDGFHFNGLLSEAQNAKKIVIHIHGMAGSILLEDYYQHMHDVYPQSGISFLAGEHRGTGTVTDFVHEGEDVTVGNAFEKFEDCVFDIQGWIDYAKKLGYEEIWLQAHSLGPSKVLYYLSQTKDPKVTGIILMSPSDMIGLVHDPEGQKDHDKLLPEAKQLVAAGSGKTLLSHTLWGYALLSADTYLNFFDQGANTAIFNYHNNELGWTVVNSISVPVLAITGTKDDGITAVMDPYIAMQKLEKELIHSPRIKTVVYSGAEHSFSGFGEQIVKEVISFVNAQ